MDLGIEFAENPDPRCAVVLLLDTSGSMSGEPIDQLNQGVDLFQQELSQDNVASRRVEVAIVSFNSYVEVVQDFVTVNKFNPPYLSATGLTAMGEAIETGLSLVESRKQIYRDNGIDYFRPWVLLITDGGPNSPNPDSNWQNAAQMVRHFAANKKVNFFTIAVEDADLNILSQIAPPDTPPLKLKGLAFKELFLWLSSSMSGVSASKPGDQMALPDASGWAAITT